MKRPLIKFILSVLIVFILTIFFVIIVGGVSSLFVANNTVNTDESRAKTFTEVFSRIAIDEDRVNELYDYFTSRNLEMITSMLKDKVVDGEFTGKRLYTDGMVIRFDGENVEYPEHEKGTVPTITADFIKSGKTIYDEILFNGEKYPVYANIKQIKGEWYYVDWSSTEDLESINFSNSDIDSIMNSLEKAYDCYLVIRDENKNIRYSSYQIYDLVYEKSDLELTEEYFHKQIYYKYNDAQYLLNYLRLPETDWEVFSLVNTASIMNESTNWANLFFVLALLFTITMIVWNYAVQTLVKKHVLSKDQEEKYNPRKVKVVNIISGAICVILVFLICLLFSGTMILRNDILRGSEMLNNLKSGLEEDKFRQSYSISDRKDWYVYYAEKVAELCEEHNNKPNHDLLAHVSDLLDAQYIILYDEKGNEIIASNDFIDCSLSTDSKDPTSDFRRILKGVKSIVHDPAHDSFTDLDSQLLAVRMNMVGSNNYGVLVMALPTGALNADLSNSIDNRVDSLTKGDDIILGFKKDEGYVFFSNDTDFYFMDASAFGIDLDKRLDSEMNVYKIQGNKYYGQSMADTDLGYIFYYMAKDTFSLRNALRNCLLMSLCFIIVYAVGILVISFGYNQKFFEDNFLNGEPPINSRTIKIMLADGRKKQTTDISQRFSLVPNFWNNMLPEQKAEVAFDVLLTYFIIRNLFFNSGTANFSKDDYLFNYVMQGDWTRGFNLFAIFSILILLAIFTIVLIIIRNIVTLLCLVLDTKGETIVRLAYNLIQYIAFIAFLYYSFGYLGFNTAGILASVGFVTLAISMGSRDLVADVLAGLMIVFEGEYQVGDMIEVGGYRGQVQEIGVRSTKVLGRGNNVKIIGNRDVKNVINMTRMNSWIPIEIKVSSDQSLPEIEKILDEELPKIGKSNPKILGGPYYYGVLGFDKGSVRLSIMTECHEEDYNNVERALYKALYELFKKQNVMIG